MKHKTPPSSLRRLTRDLLQARWLFLLASLGTVAQVALTVLLPVLIGNAVDSVLLPQADQHLMPILGQMLLVILANTLIQWLNPLLYNQLVYATVSSSVKALSRKYTICHWPIWIGRELATWSVG